MRADLIINPLTHALPSEDSQVHKVSEFSLNGLKGKAGFMNDLPLIKGLMKAAKEQGQYPCPGDRAKELDQFVMIVTLRHGSTPPCTIGRSRRSHGPQISVNHAESSKTLLRR